MGKVLLCVRWQRVVGPHGVERTAGRVVHEDEDDQRDADQGRDHPEESKEDVAHHTASPPCASTSHLAARAGAARWCNEILSTVSIPAVPQIDRRERTYR